MDQQSRLEKALEIASALSRQRIAEAKKLVPAKLELLMAKIETYIFDKRLSVKWARARASFGDNSASSMFHLAVGTPPYQFILQRRMETADVLLRRFELKVGQVAKLVGFSTPGAFSKRYLAWSGKRPSQVRGKMRPVEMEQATWRRAWLRLLSPEEAAAFKARFDSYYPDPEPAAAEGEPEAEEDPPPMDEGPRYERWAAARLWRKSREKPFEEQQADVQWHRFRTTALVDLLLERSREEGRKDRQLGVRLAKLALLAVERGGDSEGEGVYDRRAYCLAWLGRCRRLADDIPGAEAEFRAAWVQWRVPRAKPDPAVEAEICLHQGTLRMFQRRYQEARELLQRALALFKAEGDTRGQIQALIQRAATRAYADELKKATVDLNAAASLVDEDREPYLAFTIYRNLANTRGRAGACDEALNHLNRCKDRLARIDYPLGKTELKWLEASIKEVSGELTEADRLYREARAELIQAGESSSLALVSLDWSALCSDQGRHARVLRLMAEALPILEAHRFHPETLAALAVISEAIKAGEITSALLRKAQSLLRQDPLVLLI